VLPAGAAMTAGANGRPRPGTMARKNRRNKHHRPRIKRRTAPGAMPGTVRVAFDSHPSAIQLIAYRPTHCLERSIKRIDELDQYVGQYPICWINVDGLGDEGLIRALGERFALHPLALEDVVNVHQLAKVEPYDKYLFVVLRTLEQSPELHPEQISLFVGENFLLSFQERPGDCFDPIRDRVRKNSGRIRSSGTDYLMYSLIDTIVDSYFPLVDAAADRLDRLDEDIAGRRMGEVMSDIHHARNELLLLRRYVRPHRDAVNELIRDQHPLVGQEARLFLRDVYDHTMQLIDLLEIYREMCSDLRDFYLSVNSNRLNEVMKLLTIIATIFIPLSFITGLYGMNFDTRWPLNMPELRWRFGYPFALSVMGSVAVGLLYFFWRRGWLGADSLGDR
jgi:magnesium transporter